MTPGIAYFTDSHRDAVAGRFFEERVKGYVNGNFDTKGDVCDGLLYSKSFSPMPAQTINYVSCHDNNTLWDKVRICNGESDEETNIRRNLLAAGIMQVSFGVPFLMAGEEFLRTKTKADGSFDDNSYVSGDRVNALDYGRMERYGDVFEHYKKLIRFRKEHGAFRMCDPEKIEKNVRFLTEGIPEEIIAFYVDGRDAGDCEMVVFINPTETRQRVKLPEGRWKVCLKSTQLKNEKNTSVGNQTVVEKISILVLYK